MNAFCIHHATLWPATLLVQYAYSVSMHVQGLTSHRHFPLHVPFIISSQLLYDQQLQFLHVQSINQSIKLYMYQLGADKVVVVAKRSLLNTIMNRPPLALRLHSFDIQSTSLRPT